MKSLQSFQSEHQLFWNRNRKTDAVFPVLYFTHERKLPIAKPIAVYLLDLHLKALAEFQLAFYISL
jgi:hypothetical protein